MIPVIVINLKRNTERRARVSDRLNALGIAFEVFDGIDGSTLSKEERDRIAPPKRWLRAIEKRHPIPGEIGCALSHIEAIRANAEHEFFCVLEDDAVPSPDMLKFLDPTILRTLPRFDTLRLYNICGFRIPHGNLPGSQVIVSAPCLCPA